MDNVGREMPIYECHKKVWALKIKQITINNEDEAIITPEEAGYAEFPVSADYVHKHQPSVGGYYVVYKGGYKSFSPADAFKDGYTLI